MTSDDTLPDVPFFQVDANMGKHTTNLNLKDPNDRLEFEKLLKDADVVIDGYRKGAIEKLGYGPTKLTQLGIERGKGYIYGAEIVLDLLANGVVVLAGNKLLIVQVVWHGYKDYQWVKTSQWSPLSQ